MKIIMALFVCFFLFQSNVHAQVPGAVSDASQRWVTYYSDKEHAAKLLPYNPIVLDSDYYPNLNLLKEQGKVLLGYVSLGEVESERAWFCCMRI